MVKNKYANYSSNEIEGLIEYYAERDVFTSKLQWLVRFCDLDLAIREMPPKEYQAVLLVGILGLPLRVAAKSLEVSKDTVWKRYNRGIVWLANWLNGGRH